MRVLVGTRPFIGHLYPMMPFVRALARDGHEVTVASAASFLPEISRLGFDALGAGLDPRDSSVVGTAPAAGYGAEVLRSKARDITSWARANPVDVVVREPTDFAPAFAAELLGVPHVTLGRSQFLPARHWGPYVGASLAEVRLQLGLPADPGLHQLFGSCYLDMVPEWFQPPGLALPANRVEIRADGFDGPDDLADDAGWAWGLASDRRVYVTFGTHYNRNHGLVRTVVDAVSGPGGDILVTVGRDQEPRQVVPGSLPGVTVRRYVPQSRVLAGCSLVVCHGGYSTVLGSIRAGVPLVVIPRGSDHFANAEQAQRLGVAVVVGSDAVNAQAIRTAVETVLCDPEYARAAADLARRACEVDSVEYGARLLTHLPALHRRGIDVTGQSSMFTSGRA